MSPPSKPPSEKWWKPSPIKSATAVCSRSRTRSNNSPAAARANIGGTLADPGAESAARAAVTPRGSKWMPSSAPASGWAMSGSAASSARLTAANWRQVWRVFIAAPFSSTSAARRRIGHRQRFGGFFPVWRMTANWRRNDSPFLTSTRLAAPCFMAARPKGLATMRP